MRLFELLNPIAEDNMVNDDIATAINNIILRAKNRNDWEMNISQVSHEVASTMGDVFIDPEDSDFRQTIIDALQANDLVKHVDPTGPVVLNDPNKQPRIDGAEPGDEMKKQQAKQSEKIQKKAAKNVKAKAKEKPGELSL